MFPGGSNGDLQQMLQQFHREKQNAYFMVLCAEGNGKRQRKNKRAGNRRYLSSLSRNWKLAGESASGEPPRNVSGAVRLFRESEVQHDKTYIPAQTVKQGLQELD